VKVRHVDGTGAFQVAPSPPLPKPDRPALTRPEVLALLSDQRIVAHEALAAQYWSNPVVREEVTAVGKRGQDKTVELAVSFSVVVRANDAALWETLHARAMQGVRVAEAYLRNWPEPRGVTFFERAFAPDAERLGVPLLGNAFLFFLSCGVGQGFEYLTHRLGDPLAVPSQPCPIRRGRIEIGSELHSAVTMHDLKPREDWPEYIAACLRGERVLGQEAAAWEGLRFLTACKDPRTPIVLQRLVQTVGAYDPEDVVPALTAAPGPDALAVALALREHCRERKATAGGRRLEALEWLEAMLQDAAAQLGRWA
jgi:hypothetical protein